MCPCSGMKPAVCAGPVPMGVKTHGLPAAISAETVVPPTVPVMVLREWGGRVIVKVWFTGVAAAYSASPAWLACNVHSPVRIRRSEVPVTTQV